jgi:hypothetical protein
MFVFSLKIRIWKKIKTRLLKKINSIFIVKKKTIESSKFYRNFGTLSVESSWG